MNDQSIIQSHLHISVSIAINRMTNSQWITRHVGAAAGTLVLPQQWSNEHCNFQCKHFNRNGPLCGKCMSGYAVSVNTYDLKCVPQQDCSNWSLTILAGELTETLSCLYRPLGSCGEQTLTTIGHIVQLQVPTVYLSIHVIETDFPS